MLPEKSIRTIKKLWRVKANNIFSAFETSQRSQIQFGTAKVSNFTLNSGIFHWKVRIPHESGSERESLELSREIIHYTLESSKVLPCQIGLKKIRTFQHNPFIIRQSILKMLFCSSTSSVHLSYNLTFVPIN